MKEFGQFITEHPIFSGFALFFACCLLSEAISAIKAFAKRS